jgi:phosphatidylinositol alpha-1,6-mannosyltransferase
MASGLPVIASSSGGPQSFVNTIPGQPNGWLVAPDDEDDLAGAIIEATVDAAQRRRRGRRGRQLVESEYDWQHIARRFEAIYTDLHRQA